MTDPDAGALAERAGELPDMVAIAPAAAAHQLRRFVSSMDKHPAIARWGRDMLLCLVAQVLIDDMTPDAKKVFRQFGITIPDA